MNGDAVVIFVWVRLCLQRESTHTACSWLVKPRRAQSNIVHTLLRCVCDASRHLLANGVNTYNTECTDRYVTDLPIQQVIQSTDIVCVWHTHTHISHPSPLLWYLCLRYCWSHSLKFTAWLSICVIQLRGHNSFGMTWKRICLVSTLRINLTGVYLRLSELYKCTLTYLLIQLIPDSIGCLSGHWPQGNLVTW